MQLASLTGLFSNIHLFEKSSGSVLGIDVGSSAVKVVQLKKKSGQAVLETYGELALGPYGGVEVGRATQLPVERLEEALKDLMREANITTNNAAVAIPISSALISLVEMPTLDEKKMAEMIPLEARRYIPLPISEVTLDWWLLPKEEQQFVAPGGSATPQDSHQGKTDVLLVAVLNEALEKYRRIVKDLALEKSFVEIELFSTIRSVLDHGIAPVIILDLGAATTKLYLVERGVVKDSHIINRGSQDVTLALSRSMNIPVAKAEELKRTVGLSTDPSNKQVREGISLVLDNIFAEANRVLLAFETRFHRTVSKIVLTGGGVVMKGFFEAAKLRLQTEAVQSDPFSKTVTPPFLAPTLKEIGPEFAVAIGLALQKLNQV